MLKKSSVKVYAWNLQKQEENMLTMVGSEANSKIGEKRILVENMKSYRQRD